MIRLVHKEDLPLLLASPRFASESETEPLDRLRMQKGVFLLQMRGPDEWQSLYRFVPYDWGPYSRDLPRDLAQAVDLDLVVKERRAGDEYMTHRTTAAGETAI